LTAFRRLLLTTLVLAAGLTLVPVASGATCAQQVIDDWWDNGKVDEIYAVHCYREAIDALPEDLSGYSSAADDINRALQNRLRDQQSAGGGDSAEPSEGGSSGSGAETGGGGAGGEAEPPPAEAEGAVTEEGSTTEEGGGAGSGSGNGTGAAGGVAGENGQEAPAADGPVAAPPENLFGEDLDDGAGGPLPVPLIIVFAALGLAAIAVAAKLLLGRRGGHGGGSPGSSGAGLGG
jgi:hypothetical protein